MEKMIVAHKTGAKVRMAICYNLWPLEHGNINLTINFGCMRPVYLHLIATMEDQMQRIKVTY